MLVEICVEDAGGIQAAETAGADRVEVCANLSVGGLTAGQELITYAITAAVNIPVQFLIRTRPGNFVYSQAEVQHMCEQIRHIKAQAQAAGVGSRVGFVVGALTESGKIDEPASAAFRQAAGEASLTFHRAFDATTDLERSLETLVTLSFDRVLTTGGDPAVANIARLAALEKLSVGRIIILASGGLRAGNVAQIVQATGVHEVHMRAPYPAHSGIAHPGTPRLGTNPAAVKPESAQPGVPHPGTDPAQVRAILENLASAGLRTRIH